MFYLCIVVWGIIKIAPGFLSDCLTVIRYFWKKEYLRCTFISLDFVYGIAVYRAGCICSTWKGKKSNIFFDFPKGDHCGAFDNIVAEG